MYPSILIKELLIINPEYDILSRQVINAIPGIFLFPYFQSFVIILLSASALVGARPGMTSSYLPLGA
jgi:hypothetical protein